jgi:hypothetical protein
VYRQSPEKKHKCPTYEKTTSLGSSDLSCSRLVQVKMDNIADTEIANFIYISGNTHFLSVFGRQFGINKLKMNISSDPVTSFLRSYLSSISDQVCKRCIL